MVSLAILGCKLFIREIFKLVSQLCCFSNPFLYVKGSLSSEILYWRFLDGWSDLLPLALRTAGNGFASLCPGYTRLGRSPRSSLQVGGSLSPGIMVPRSQLAT